MTAPVRVLLFSTLYPSAARPQHGLFVETRLRQLTDSGQVEARVVAPVPWFPSADPRFGEWASMAATPRCEQRHGLHVEHPRYPLPPKIGMLPAPLLLALGAAAAIRRARREGFDFDLIDAHYFYPDGVAAALLAGWFGRPLLITARGSDLNLVAGHAGPRRMMQWASRRAAANLAVSAALAEVLLGWGTDPARVHVVRNGVDLARFVPEDRDAARRELGLAGGPWLVSVGNLVALKRHRIAIDVLSALRTRWPQARLAIVGQGPLRDELRAQAERLDLGGSVVFAGARPQAELRWWYAAADLMVLASEREGWPNVVLEALACGTPVLASRVGGIPEILDRPGLGALVAPDDEAGFAAAAAALIEAPPERARLRTHAQSMDWTATRNALLALFRAAARPHNGGARAATP